MFWKLVALQTLYVAARGLSNSFLTLSRLANARARQVGQELEPGDVWVVNEAAEEIDEELQKRWN